LWLFSSCPFLSGPDGPYRYCPPIEFPDTDHAGRSPHTCSREGDEHEGIEDFLGAAVGRVEGPSPDFRQNAFHERVVLERRSPGLGPHYPPGRIDAKPDEQLAPDRGVPAECGGIERLQFGEELAHSLPYHVPDPGRDRVSLAGSRPPEHCRNLHFPPHPHTGNPAGPALPLQVGDLPPERLLFRGHGG